MVGRRRRELLPEKGWDQWLKGLESWVSAQALSLGSCWPLGLACQFAFNHPEGQFVIKGELGIALESLQGKIDLI